MKLLILTQKVDKNDEILGFFHAWLQKFAEHYDFITVICLQAGEHDLPDKVKVLSLGKETKISRWQYLTRFYKYIWQERHDYDQVFVHMNVEYVVLGGLIWRILGKKIALWYVHRQVSIKLVMAKLFAHVIFSINKNTFRLISRKLKLLGHGIETDKFQCIDRKVSERLNIISVGRITKIKNLATLILAAKVLLNKLEQKFVINIIGSPITKEDEKYLTELKTLVNKNNLQSVIKFYGSVSNSDMVEIYCQSDLLINLAPTGGLDKVVLEAMSCHLPVLVANQSFANDFGQWSNKLIFEYNNVNSLATQIENLVKINKNELTNFLRQQVVTNHNLDYLINNIVDELKK